MAKSCALVLSIVAALIAAPAHASDNSGDRMVIFEAAVKIVSDDAYMEILRQGWSKGLRFTPEQVESGGRRHFEELKLRLIDKGYVILPGETGA
jgi:hypothetical protein